MTYPNGIKKPSEHLHDLLSGAVAPEDTPEDVLSWARLAIFQAANQIMNTPGRKKRRKMLGKIPPSIRPYVEREVKKMWEERKCR